MTRRAADWRSAKVLARLLQTAAKKTWYEAARAALNSHQEFCWQLALNDGSSSVHARLIVPVERTIVVPFASVDTEETR